MATAVTRSQLGKMALNAAISIERSQKNLTADIATVRHFLSAVSNELDDSQSPSILRDETMFPYYSYALAKANTEEITTRSQFASSFRNALDRHIGATDEGDHLEQVKQFCLAFHEAMIRASQNLKTSNSRIDGRIR